MNVSEKVRYEKSKFDYVDQGEKKRKYGRIMERISKGRKSYNQKEEFVKRKVKEERKNCL